MACKLSFEFSNWSRSFPSGFVACEHTPRFSQPIPRLHTGPPVSQVGNGTLQRGPDAPQHDPRTPHRTLRHPKTAPVLCKPASFACRCQQADSPTRPKTTASFVQRGPQRPLDFPTVPKTTKVVFQQLPKPRKWFSNSAQNLSLIHI